MRKKQRKKVMDTQDLVLIDGYYIPKVIVEPYKRMRANCIFELSQVFERQGLSTASIVEEVGMFMYVKDSNRVIYRIELSPQHISHIDKLIGTKRMMEYLELFKEETV